MSTVEQRDLFAAAAERRADGIARADEHAPDDWREEAFAFLRRYAETHAEVFVDDVRAAGLPTPPEARALGPLFLRAVREGLIAKTGSYRPSVASNLSPKPVWASLVYRGRAA